jgi:hypothetical protein
VTAVDTNSRPKANAGRAQRAASRTAHCRYHCSACGAHFSSLNAFDAHRVGDHGEGARHCLEPLDDERFAAVAEPGVCAMYVEPRVGIRIWTLGPDLERARERSGGGPRTPAEGELDLEAA